MVIVLRELNIVIFLIGELICYEWMFVLYLLDVSVGIICDVCWGFVFNIATVCRKCKELLSVYCCGKGFLQFCSGFVFIIHAVGSKSKQSFIVIFWAKER
jgi:predicted amidophosphoribosyltransferase